MAVPEVGAGIRREVVIGEAAADVDGDRGVRHAVIDRRSVGIPVEVNGVLLEQVWPHDHARVGKGEEHFVVLIECNQRRWDVAIHDSNINDLAGIYVAIKTRGSAGSRSYGIQVGGYTHGSVPTKSRPANGGSRGRRRRP